jgi:hypothetical protein
MAEKNKYKLTSEKSSELDDLFGTLEDKVSGKDYPKGDLTKAVEWLIKKAQRNLKEKNLIASGKLSASIAPVLPFEYEKGLLKFGIELEDYWRKVEEGTPPKPGYTQTDLYNLQKDIKVWISNKPDLQRKVEAKSRDSLSYLIANKILEKGTIKRFKYSGYPFLSKELETFRKKVLKAYEDGINDI